MVVELLRPLLTSLSLPIIATEPLDTSLHSDRLVISAVAFERHDGRSFGEKHIVEVAHLIEVSRPNSGFTVSMRRVVQTGGFECVPWFYCAGRHSVECLGKLGRVVNNFIAVVVADHPPADVMSVGSVGEQGDRSVGIDAAFGVNVDSFLAAGNRKVFDS